MTPSFTVDWVVSILKNEKYVLRFEDLCVDLFSEITGRLYVSTSRTHDHGRDGRAVVGTESSEPAFICCSTDDSAVDKAISDLKRILEFVVPTDVLFCFTDDTFSEDKHDKIINTAMQLCPQLKSADAYGARQLAEILVHHAAHFEHHYAAELSDIRHALATPMNAANISELSGLRIALTTQFHDEAQQTKKNVVQTLILTSLAQVEKSTVNKITQYISDKLHLARRINAAWFAPELNWLHSSGLIDLDGEYISLTDEGRLQIESLSDRGADRLISGRSAMKRLLESNLGYSLSSEEFSITWNLIENAVVSMFISHGQEVVDTLASVLEEEKPNQREHVNLREQIKKISLQLSANAQPGTRQFEIARAVEDVFRERSSDAFKWLCDVASVFLHLCALGLSPATQQHVSDRIAELDIILDSDIALSLLGTSEPNHQAIKEIIRCWKAFGGRVLITDCVLEELAHHAWISDIEYAANWRNFKDMTPEDAEHLLRNVFVRTFWHESTDRVYSKSRWASFLSAFRGSSDHDSKKIRDLLADDGVEYVAECPVDESSYKFISDQLFNSRKDKTFAPSLNALREKCNRDARLAVFLRKHSDKIKEQSRQCICVSSSMALRAAMQVQMGNDGYNQIWYTAAVAWMLSQLPGAHMTPTCLRGVMLDVDFPFRLDALEEAALRVLHNSSEWKIHFSRRSTMVNGLRTEMHKRANAEAVDMDQIVDDFIRLDPEKIERNQDMLMAAVDGIAYSESEKERHRLEAEIERLKAENFKLRYGRR